MSKGRLLKLKMREALLSTRDSVANAGILRKIRRQIRKLENEQEK